MNFEEKIDYLLFLGMVDGERRKLLKKGILEHVRELVAGVIGEDQSVDRYMGAQGMENNPWEEARNELRAEQRANLLAKIGEKK